MLLASFGRQRLKKREAVPGASEVVGCSLACDCLRSSSPRCPPDGVCGGWERAGTDKGEGGALKSGRHTKT